MTMTDVFILTKPPGSTRAELCFTLMERSTDPELYLIGDGVFHLIKPTGIPAGTIITCKDDALTRGIPAEEGAYPRDEFYERLVTGMMENSDHVYSF